MKSEKTEIWNQVLDSIKVSVSSAIFTTWLSKTYIISLRKTNETRYLAEIGCKSAFIRETVEKRYFGMIQDALIKIVGSPVDLLFVVKQNPDEPVEKDSSPAPLFDDSKDNDSEEVIEKLVHANIRPGFTFKNFAVSSSNQMAYAAAQAVAEKPAVSYNPLFLWGGVGVGKTHLMHAVGTVLLQRDGNSKVLACTAENFTNDIVEGIRNKTTQNVRNKYRKLDALFVDDIQFIGGKDTVQDEFFHTFNEVLAGGGQIILTSDKPPSEIARLEERLRSRFEAGLIVDISPPDFELRCAIIEIKAGEKGIHIETPLVHLIAGNIDTARKIEGFLVRLGSEVKLRNMPASEELIKTILGKGGLEGEVRKKMITTDEVIDIVCNYYSISKRAMLGQARARMIARPRQVLMYILRTELKMAFEEVGQLIGGRNHSTVMHAVDTITELASRNVQIRDDVLKIKNSL